MESKEDLYKELIEELTAVKETQSTLVKVLQGQIKSLEATNRSKDKMIEAYEEALHKLGLK